MLEDITVFDTQDLELLTLMERCRRMDIGLSFDLTGLCAMGGVFIPYCVGFNCFCMFLLSGMLMENRLAIESTTSSFQAFFHIMVVVAPCQNTHIVVR